MYLCSPSIIVDEGKYADTSDRRRWGGQGRRQASLVITESIGIGDCLQTRDFEQHLRVGILLAHGRIVHAGGVPRDRFVRQPNLERCKEHRQHNFWGTDRVSMGEKGMTLDILISNCENLNPLR